MAHAAQHSPQFAGDAGEVMKGKTGAAHADGVDPEHLIIGQQTLDQVLGAGGVLAPILAQYHQLRQ
ncbi:hypothetical protein D3C80_2142270 [compost metagenome]